MGMGLLVDFRKLENLDIERFEKRLTLGEKKDAKVHASQIFW